ncbi:MAG: hypothetical protein Q8S33_04800 [Myxococcales bacterium]|nr:hypothetical protein [Myxococcales bacterium]
MRRTCLLAVAVVALGCRAPVKPAPEDAGVDEVAFEGEASENPPEFAGDLFDAGNKSEFDAGEAVVDMRCCRLNFRIDVGDEPSDSVGQLIGEQAPLSRGVPLVRVDGGYVASACFPLASSTYYSYQFQYLTDDAGSGGLDQGDGGFVVTTRRHSTYEPGFSIAGEIQNYIPSVTDCSALDAGQEP